MSTTSIKKYIVGGVLVAALGFYIVLTNSNAMTISPPSLANDPGQTGSATSTEVSTGTAGSGTPAGNGNASGTGTAGDGISTTSGQYKNGTYAGSVADAFYGNVQVAAVIKGGKLADVQLLQYPNDSGESQERSGFSLPQLKQEAIAAQSANVDIISGATQTSEAFKQSLATALNKAQS